MADDCMSGPPNGLQQQQPAVSLRSHTEAQQARELAASLQDRAACPCKLMAAGKQKLRGRGTPKSLIRLCTREPIRLRTREQVVQRRMEPPSALGGAADCKVSSIPRAHHSD